MGTVTTSCPTCGAEAPDGARFCPSCGARLEADGPEMTERKVVTTLFADLVGFTALGERNDPEDIDTALRGYYALARTIIERFGGVVEKFIGDAVVGLFGVPLAHEDDAERAVRAALEIIAHMHELPPIGGEQIQVRCAVNTGPALVRLNVSPVSGEAIQVGDAVNTAARLLGSAAPMTVVVGDRTRSASFRSILYKELAAVSVKGKTQPVRCWLARGAVSRRGISDAAESATEMIGREVELAVLGGMLEKAIASRTAQSVLIEGEAGIGKSRLVREFFRVLDTRPGLLVTWRQGRCIPYGDGLAYWPLREIVADHAGILQTDSHETIEEKLALVLGGDAGNQWLVSRLRPLVGLPAPETDRDELFSAWLQFLTGLAAERPAIVVIEDLQWASQPTLEFLQHFRQHANVPLLLVTTARPEFLDAHADFARPTTSSAIVELKSLSPSECRRLADGLARATGFPDVGAFVSDRARGNPLFVEELVRYKAAQKDAVSDDSPAEADLTDAPDTITALIAARLDALAPEHRSVLSNAAVVGSVFWSGALRALADTDTDGLEEALDELAAREFIVRRDESTVEGDREFAFWHGLTRDVAYSQIPRAVRAAKHAGVAGWIDSAPNPSGPDVSSIKAYHLVTALTLAAELGDHEQAERLCAPAVRALEEAGERTARLDVAEAARHFAKAVELVPLDSPDRPRLMVAWGSLLRHTGEFRLAEQILREGIDGLKARGELRAAAVAMLQLSNVRWLLGEDSAGDDAGAAALLAGDGPSPELVAVLADTASTKAHSTDYEAAVVLADRAIAMSNDLDAPRPHAAVANRGIARCCLGDRGGLDDLADALTFFEQGLHTAAALAVRFNAAEMLALFEGPEAALSAHEHALRLAEDHGSPFAVGYCREGCFADRVFAGQWQAAAEDAPALDALFEERLDVWDLRHLRHTRALLLCWQGHSAEASPLAEWVEESSRRSVQLPSRAAGLIALASANLHSGDKRGAMNALSTCETLPHALRGHPDYVLRLPEAARIATSLGQPDLALRLADEVPRGPALSEAARETVGALYAEACGDAAAERRWAQVQEAWRELKMPFEEAHAHLGMARCRAAGQDSSAAVICIKRAAEVFAELGASQALRQTEVLAASLQVGSSRTRPKLR